MAQVSFAYPSNPQQLVLNTTSFFFPIGRTTFVVGKSGSGKTTLGNLLMKYYGTAQGNILIDGCPIQTLDAECLRRNITLVQQEIVLFNETVYQNIAFGREGAVASEDVLNATKTADLQQTIIDLPKGLETLVE
jgi:ATP-binding cassette subfamily B (MDR/TAP) protein 1